MDPKIITITVNEKQGEPPATHRVAVRSLTAAEVIEVEEDGHHTRMEEAFEAKTLSALLKEQLAFLGRVFPGVDFAHALEGPTVVSDAYAAVWHATNGKEEAAGPGAPAGSP